MNIGESLGQKGKRELCARKVLRNKRGSKEQKTGEERRQEPYKKCGGGKKLSSEKKSP